MKNGLFKKILPHLIAVAVFLIVALIYCKPAIEGKVLAQHDITHWKGSIQSSVVYKEKHGEYPLWTNSLFSGMPAFQIGYPANNYIPWIAHEIFSLGLPTPIQFFFLACIFFYFLSQVLGVNPYVGIMGALGYAYATYDPVIIAVGHDTKMLSIAYMPALLGSILLIFDKKYWIGAALTALFASVLIAMNHPQIDYYLFLALGIMTIFFAVRWIIRKEFRHLVLAAVFTAGAALIGVLSNAVTLMATYEYQKETIRGGESDLDKAANPKSDNAKTGLDKDYAFSYSMGITEPFVMLVPRMFGGSSDHQEVQEDKSKAIEALQALPKELQQQLPLTYYWGGMTKQGEVGTSGPPYAGAIICFLAILGMFILDNKHKWWLLAAILFSVILSWGSYFEGFNVLLYKYLPFYNKFRAPSMILVIPQLLLPVLAALSLNKIINTQDRKSLWPTAKKGLIATGAVFALLFILYISFDFLSPGDKNILTQVRGMSQPQLYEYVKSFYDGLKQDRKSLMIDDILRSLGFIIAAGFILFLLLRNSLKPIISVWIIAALVMIDLMSVDVKYLNSDNYQDKEENTISFQRTKADDEILADTSYYRVFNVGGDRFSENITSYYYNSVGGYHPAKLTIYADLIQHQLSKQNPEKVLDMLNTKYLIQKNQSGQTAAYQKRETALGPVWFVKGIEYVKDATAEMAALDNFNPKDTAIVQESFKPSIPFAPQYDSAASIHLIKNDNDVITYESNAATNQFAVFSEIYYTGGWKAYVDGKETPIVKVNYVLRGLPLPAGKHQIRFEFKPESYFKGRKITSVFSIILVLLLAAGIFMEWRTSKSLAPKGE
ncbi:MAG: YfhO family protein [Bacteroidetes bacterium]|nr:YfhO family protein [Bacteroidota bacterium]